MKRLVTERAEETRLFGASLAKTLTPQTLITLQGDLGAGKTTLIQGILEELGAEKPYISPTFVLMKLYELKKPALTGVKRIYHVDCYRVAAKDFENLGFFEWLNDPEGLVLVEWPERIASLLPEKRHSLALRTLEENEREITFHTPEETL